jgi:hypothetical protein
MFTLWAAILLFCSYTTVSAKTITIYVSSTSTNKTIPCGFGSTNVLSCKNLTAALQSIQKYSTLTADIAEIRLLSGSFEACSLSYKKLVIPTTTGAPRTITFMPNTTTTISTIICSKTNATGIGSLFFSMDYSGITYNFKNLTFRSNSSNDKLAMIYSPASIFNKLTISFCKFYGNSSSLFPSVSAISYADTNRSNTVVVSNSYFESLSTAINIPSADIDSFALINWTVNINFCTFTKIKSFGLKVGYDALHRVFVNDSTFVSNLGIDVSILCGTAVFTRSTFTDSAQVFQFNFFDLIQIQNCLFNGTIGTVITSDNNFFMDVYISDSTFVACSTGLIEDNDFATWYLSHVTVSDHEGDNLFHASYGSFQIDNCTFSSLVDVSILYGGYILNISRSIVSGFLAADFSESGADFDVTISNSVFKNLNVFYSFLSSDGTSGVVTIQESTFSDIAGECNCGFICLYQSSVMISKAVFSSTLLSFGSILDLDQFSSLVMVDSTFDNIVSDSGDGPVLALSGVSFANVSRCNFSNLYTLYNGGFLLVQGSSQIVLSLSRFYNVSADGDGGVIYMDEDFVVSISSCIFLLTASSGDGGVIYGASTGISSSLSISGSFFNSNYAGGSGGSIFLNSLPSLTVRTSSFSDSSSDFEGGCIYSQTIDSFLITSSTFSSCRSNDSGGACYLSYVLSPKINSSRFSGCSAVQGGAIYLDDNVDGALVDKTSFVQNQVTTQGGSISAIGLYTSLNLSSCVFNLSTAENGGAVFVSKSRIGITKSQFFSNSAVYSNSSLMCSDVMGSGGAIFFNDTLTAAKASLISSSTFISNRASFFGGAIGVASVDNSSQVAAFLLNNNIFSGGIGSYGPNLGSSWTSFSASSNKTTFFLSETGTVYFSLRDTFNQSAKNLICNAQLLLQTSSPSGYFEISGSNTFNFNVTDNRSPVNFQLRWFQDLLFVPAASVMVNVSILPCFEKLTGFDCLSSALDFHVRLCPSGYEVQRSGIPDQFFSCVSCTPGKYLDKDNCIDCPSGTFSGLSATSCEPCQPGYMIDSQRTSCYLCAPGSFTTAAASTTCTACPYGFYSEDLGSTFCTSCPDLGTTLKIGAISEFDCVCPNGTSGEPSKGRECRSCENSSRISCPANSTIPFINPGYWRSPKDSSLALECVPRTACSDTQMNASTTCASAYTGVLCGECINTDYQWLAGLCVKCPSPTAVGLTFGIISLVICAYLAQAMMKDRHSTSRSELKVFVMWLQSMALFARVSDKWPTGLLRLLSALNVLVNILILTISLILWHRIWMLMY